jgi:hypothetical protein
MKKVYANLIFTVDLYNVNLKEYVHGYSMVGYYINEGYDALKKFQFELNKIIKLDSNSKFDILRFSFREEELFSSLDISKTEYCLCKCDIVEAIFNILHGKFYGNELNDDFVERLNRR